MTGTNLEQRVRHLERRGLPAKGYTSSDLEAMTAISKSTYDTWRSEGRGPRFIHVEGKKVIYPADLFEQWWEEQCEEAEQ